MKRGLNTLVLGLEEATPATIANTILRENAYSWKLQTGLKKPLLERKIEMSNCENRTCQVVFNFDLDKELKNLLKGKNTPGTVEYTFGTYQTAARWLKENKTAQRLFKKAQEIIWKRESPNYLLVAFANSESSRETFWKRVDEILSSEKERKLDEIYLKEWAKIH
jgi:hypothetical protein